MVFQYVDDDKEDLEYFKECVNLVDPGITIETYNNGDSYLEEIKANSNCGNLIFLDLNMPGKTGFEILQELKKTSCFKKSVIIIYSTSDNPETINLTRELGASLYIIKPNDFDHLKEIIKELIDTDWKKFTSTSHKFVINKN